MHPFGDLLAHNHMVVHGMMACPLTMHAGPHERRGEGLMGNRSAVLRREEAQCFI